MAGRARGNLYVLLNASCPVAIENRQRWNDGEAGRRTAVALIIPRVLLAKLLRWLTRFRRIQPRVGRLHSYLLRHSRGRLRRSRLLAAGQPVLALTTTGRRSGSPRTTTVAYVRRETGYAVTAMNLGSDDHPAWCLNLRANPRAWIHVNGERKAVTAREAQGEEAEAIWQAVIAQNPASSNFRAITARDIPIFVLDELSHQAESLRLPR